MLSSNDDDEVTHGRFEAWDNQCEAANKLPAHPVGDSTGPTHSLLDLNTLQITHTEHYVMREDIFQTGLVIAGFSFLLAGLLYCLSRCCLSRFVML